MAYYVGGNPVLRVFTIDNDQYVIIRYDACQVPMTYIRAVISAVVGERIRIADSMVIGSVQHVGVVVTVRM